MATAAQRLPVIPVPEQREIPFVRNDVINLGCRYQEPLLEALDAERILGKESFRGDAPFVAITA